MVSATKEANSENLVVSSHHVVTSTIASFDENETAQMLRIVNIRVSRWMA